jgi:uncharacterized protein (TIGR03086 family)
VTELDGLHRRAGDLLIQTIKQVRDEQLHRPTPCTEWDVRDLLHHIAWSNLWVAPLIDGEDLADVAPSLKGDVLGDNPAGVTIRSVEESSDAFERGIERTVQLSRGPSPASVYCAERTNDLTVHTWDLARGIGEDVRSILDAWSARWRSSVPSRRSSEPGESWDPSSR